METTVYQRDASFNRSGRPSGKTLRWHYASLDHPGMSACQRVLLHDGITALESEVRPDDICGACKVVRYHARVMQ